MDLELFPKSDSPIINGYGKGYITISGQKIFNIIILYPDKYIEIKNRNFELIVKSLQSYKNNLDLIIYGNSKGIDDSQNILDKLKPLLCPIEFMHTSAACRTWSVLISEGRSIGAIIEPF